MITICPTVTAYDEYEYNEQIKLLKTFADHIHIDLMDGEFAPTTSPPLRRVWWPHSMKTDIHLMYKKPMDQLEELIRLKPNTVIIHNEAEVHHMHFAAELHKHGIKAGLALLQDTPIEWAEQIMHSFDQILVFSGNLGHHGGQADMELVDKVKKIKELHPDAEIAWDGGINDTNARILIDAGVSVLNVGGYIHQSDDPATAYAKLREIV